MVQDHYIVHVIDLFKLIELQVMGIVVLRLANFDENPINQSNTTLELQDMCTNSNQFFNCRPLNLITYGFFNAR
jgi:hypothetical protein